MVSSSRILSGGWVEVPRTQRKCNSEPEIKVRHFHFRTIKAHVFFDSINWSDLENRRVIPPFKPQVAHEMDTR